MLSRKTFCITFVERFGDQAFHLNFLNSPSFHIPFHFVSFYLFAVASIEVLTALSLQRLSGPPGMTMDWQGAPASPSSYTVKRILRLEIPVDTYPNVSLVLYAIT